MSYDIVKEYDQLLIEDTIAYVVKAFKENGASDELIETSIKQVKSKYLKE